MANVKSRAPAGPVVPIAGVGLSFASDATKQGGLPYVQTISKGGSAENPPKIKKGDFITAVEAAPTKGKTPMDVQKMIVGEIGTYVTLSMLRGAEDGTQQQFDVRLMRGQAEYLASKERAELLSILEHLRKQLQHAEVEKAARREALTRSMSQTGREKDEVERLTNQIEAIKTKIQMMQSEIAALQSEKERLAGDVEGPDEGVKEEMANLERLLAEADAHWNAAKESLETDQRAIWELEDKWKKERTAREQCEARIKQMEIEIPSRVQQERMYRENQEQLRKKLEDSRDKFKKSYEDALIVQQEEKEKLDIAENQSAQTEQMLGQVQAKNQEIQGHVKEIEKMLRAAEGERLEIMSRHETLNSDLTRTRNQAQVREQLIVDLQARIEEDYERWQQAVSQAKDNRQQDENRFLERERSLQDQIRKIQDEKVAHEETVSQILQKMENQRVELTRRKEKLEQDLVNQRNVSAKLRDEVSELQQKQQQCDQDILNCRAEIQRVDGARRGHEAEKNVSDQRKAQIEAEFEIALKKEQLRMDYISESQRQHNTTMEELGKAIVEVDQELVAVSAEKDKVDADLENCTLNIKKLKDFETARNSRMEEFRDKRYGMLEKFTELLIMQDGLRRVLEDVRMPVGRTVGFYNRNYASVAPAKQFNAFEYSDKNLEKAGLNPKTGNPIGAGPASPAQTMQYAQMMQQMQAMQYHSLAPVPQPMFGMGQGMGGGMPSEYAPAMYRSAPSDGAAEAMA